MPKPSRIRDLIGVALLVLTGVLYMTGVTEANASASCDCEPDTTEAVGASFDVETPVMVELHRI